MPDGIPNLFIEPDCEHNCLVKKGCLKPTIGDLVKSCALQGSQSVLLPVSDAAHLVYGNPECVQNSWKVLESKLTELQQFPLIFSMGYKYTDIVLNDKNILLNAICYIAEHFKPSCIFVYTPCINAIATDDLKATCEKAEEICTVPAVPIYNSVSNTGANMGCRQAGESLFETVIGMATKEPLKLTLFDMNLIGGDSFSREGDQIEAILSKIGVRVLSRIGGECTFDELRTAHQVKLNMLISSRSMLTLVRKMRESYGIPYFEGSFYGSREIRFSLMQIAFFFQNPELDKRIVRYMRREEVLLRKDISRSYKSLKGKKIVLFTDGIESWTFISMLYELGMKIVAIGTNQNAQEDISRIKERMKEKTVLIDHSDENKILTLYRERKAELMIVSRRNSYVPLKEKIPFLDVDESQHSIYVGYEGVRRFAKDLLDTLEQPIWKIICRLSPWEVDSYGEC